MTDATICEKHGTKMHTTYYWPMWEEQPIERKYCMECLIEELEKEDKHEVNNNIF